MNQDEAAATAAAQNEDNVAANAIWRAAVEAIDSEERTVLSLYSVLTVHTKDGIAQRVLGSVRSARDATTEDSE